jgi:ATP/maltotriose-dependent transcriptional regulator MalT
VPLEEALALAHERQDLGGIAQALTFLGMCALRSGEAAAAISLLEDALTRARALGAAYDAGFALYFLGTAALALGKVDEAAARNTEALDLLEAAGDVRLVGDRHFALASLAARRGDLPAAVKHLEAGLAASITLRDRWLLSTGIRAVLTVVGDHSDLAVRARLLGAADALGHATGATLGMWERAHEDPEILRLREHVAYGERGAQGEWAAAYREGRALPAAEVITLVSRLLNEVAPEGAAALVPRPAQDATATEPPPTRPPIGSAGSLSAREQEVLRLVAQGLSSRAIGQRLFLAPSTVSHHLTTIFNKLGVNTRAQAVAEAARRNLL